MTNPEFDLKIEDCWGLMSSLRFFGGGVRLLTRSLKIWELVELT